MTQDNDLFDISERIKLTLKRESGDETELPFKILVMGNYQGEDSDIPFHKRTSVNIDKGNFNRVMYEMAPRLKTTVPHHLSNTPAGEELQELALDIRFHCMADFHPDNIARQIPSLDRLLRLRALLTDLKQHPDQYEQIVGLFVRIIMDECRVGRGYHE